MYAGADEGMWESISTRNSERRREKRLIKVVKITDFRYVCYKWNRFGFDVHHFTFIIEHFFHMKPKMERCSRRSRLSISFSSDFVILSTAQRYPMPWSRRAKLRISRRIWTLLWRRGHVLLRVKLSSVGPYSDKQMHTVRKLVRENTDMHA